MASQTDPQGHPQVPSDPSTRAPPSVWRRLWPGHWAPLLVFWLLWAAAAVAAWRLHQTTAGATALMPGVAETIEFRMAARQPERLVALAAELGDSVKKGDLLAVQDAGPLNRELAVLAAQLAFAEADMHTEALALGRSRVTDERIFQKTVDQTEVGLMGAKVDAERDRAELDGVQMRLKFWGKWVEDKLASAQTYEDLRAQAAVLARRIALRDQVVVAWQARLGQMKARLGHFQQFAVPDPPKAPLEELAGHRALLDVARTKLQVVETQRESLLLRAPESGVISAVWLRPGDVPTLGAPIVTIRDPHPLRVLAYGDAIQLRDLAPGHRVRISPRDGSGRSYPGRVATLALGSKEQPLQLPLGLYGRPSWAEEVVIALDTAVLRPGQVVDVIVVDGNDTPPAPRPPLLVPSFATVLPAGLPALPVAPTATSGGPAQPKPPSAVDPVALDLPAELTALTRFEPSGWMWVPQWQAWLTVSDDTGWPDRDNHAPWLFRIDKTGHVGAAPVILGDIDHIDDLESIARDSTGAIWMLASQSVSRHGHRPVARTWLLRAKLAGDTVTVTGRVSLVRALAQLPPLALRGLGLTASEPAFKHGVSRFNKLLDVEGMASVGGELWLGLKEPGATDGRALLWRLRDPDALIRQGHFVPGQLSALPPMGLRAGPAGSDRPATISDCFNLGDGRIAVLAVATPPGPGEQLASALWMAQLQADGWKMRRLRDFDGAHAEGVAFGPTPGVLAVVFDRGNLVPQWLEVPVPP